MCRFHVDDKFLLILNRNRRKKDIYQLSPIGGAIAFYNSAIIDRFAMRLEKPDTNDLRFYTTTDHIDAFREWFYQRHEREIDPFREIYEELVEEETVLPDLQRADLDIQFIHILEDSKPTQRTGATGLFTQYFFELFDVHVTNPDLIQALQTLDPASGVALLDEATIRVPNKPIFQTFDGAIRETKLVTEYLFKQK
jgi:hypothetical protein